MSLLGMILVSGYGAVSAAAGAFTGWSIGRYNGREYPHRPARAAGFDWVVILYTAVFWPVGIPMALTVLRPWQKPPDPAADPFFGRLPNGSLAWSAMSPNFIRSALGLPGDPTSKLPLPKSTRADPIVAYKRAAVTATDGGLKLFGVGMHAAYNPDDTAVCGAVSSWTIGGEEYSLPSHEAPQQWCSCGFYSMTAERLAQLGSEYPTSVADLEVEVFGTVIRHRDGYRSSRQRVLGVYLDSSCVSCRRTASGLGRTPVTSNSFYAYSSILPTDFAKRLSPVCAHCADGPVITPAELASVWGVEVRWGSIQPKEAA